MQMSQRMRWLCSGVVECKEEMSGLRPAAPLIAEVRRGYSGECKLVSKCLDRFEWRLGRQRNYHNIHLDSHSS